MTMQTRRAPALSLRASALALGVLLALGTSQFTLLGAICDFLCCGGERPAVVLATAADSCCGGDASERCTPPAAPAGEKQRKECPVETCCNAELPEAVAPVQIALKSPALHAVLSPLPDSQAVSGSMAPASIRNAASVHRGDAPPPVHVLNCTFLI